MINMIFACFAKNTFYSKSTKIVPTAHIAYIHQLKIQDKNCYYVKGYGTGELWGKIIAHERVTGCGLWDVFFLFEQ
jgi:hypothetical protein